VGRNTSHYYLHGRPNTSLSSDSCMSQACEHTWYTEGIIFNYIILGVNNEVERSSHPSKKLLKQRSARFSYLIIILLCFSYKPLLTFLLTGVSHIHLLAAIFGSLEPVLIAFIVYEIPKHFLASFFFYCTFSICNFNFYL